MKNYENKMKYILLNILLALTLGIFIAACSDIQSGLNNPPQAKVEVHKAGFAKKGSVNFHGQFIKDSNWNMKQCQQCHASDFTGGTTGQSCSGSGCHTASQGGPTACNTCHGNFNDPSRIAPPRAINGDTATSYMGVGAHSNHIYTNKLGNHVECQSCHNVPSSVNQPGHLDSELPAEVNFKGLATKGIASNAVFNPSNGTCSNTYCHGNFEFFKDSADPTNQFGFSADKMIGNNASVKWTTVDGSQDKCGSCHDLPPIGHIGDKFSQIPISVTQCYLCHEGVVDQNGKIIDQSKHINGEANARGN